jgi:hypothetical protein
MTQPSSQRRSDVLLSIQRALLGEVSPRLRAVTVTFDEKSVAARAYFDGELDDEDRESMSSVETQLLADFPEEHSVTVECHRLDAPAPIADDGTWVFARREDP